MEDILSGLRSTSDGWRAIIAESFTFSNVRRLAWAIGQYLLGDGKQNHRTVIAHDTRFMGDKFTQIVSDILISQGVVCDIVQRPIPTPLLSWYTCYSKYDIGLMITASHNPPYYNGLKIRMPYGGPPDEETMKKIEMMIPSSLSDLSKVNSEQSIVDPWFNYVELMRKKIDLYTIDKAAPIIAVDSMHGTTAGLLRDILDGTRAKVIQIRGNPDPLFGGVAPEPKSNTIGPLLEAVKQNSCSIGVAHDGDGDRIVAFDPSIGYLSPHDLITLLSFDLADRKGIDGSIVASVSTTRRVRKAAQYLGRIFHEVPIGFRNACKIMRAETVLIAGEENGGIGIGSYLPERDGTLIAALLIEMISSRRKGAGEYLSELDDIVGRASFLRKDITVDRPSKETVSSLKANLHQSIADYKILEISTIDGLKLFLEGGSWVLIRAAGTEPLIRIYAEADDALMCENIINAVRNHLPEC